MPAPHEIRRLTLQFSSPVSEAFKKQLEQEVLLLLEAIFDRYFPGEEINEISTISLNLGTIPSNGFFAEYKQRITKLLGEEFSKWTTGAPKSFVTSEDQRVPTPYQQLAYYLKNGYVSGLRISLNELFRGWLEHDPDGLETLLANIQSSSVVRLRLLNQVDVELIETYWAKAYGVSFSVIKQVNTTLMERLESTGHGSAAIRRLLHETTFDFLVSGDVWERTEQRYLTMVQHVLLRAADRSNIPLRTIRGIFRKGSSPQLSGRRSSLERFIRFALSGVRERRDLPEPDLQTIQQLATWVRSEKDVMSVSINRIISVLGPSQTRYFLQALEPLGSWRIRSILYLSNVFRQLFGFDLFQDYRVQISQILASGGQEQKAWNRFFDQVVSEIGIRTGLRTDKVNLRLEQSIERSFHTEAGVLRTWLTTTRTINLQGQRIRDPIKAWLYFLRTGTWSRRETPQVFFAIRLKDSPGALLDAWRQVSDMNLAWSRLFFQHQWSDVSDFLKLAYPDDGKILLLQTRIKDSTRDQNVLQAFLQLRQNSALTPADFKSEFNRRLKSTPSLDEKKFFNSAGDLPPDDFASENYLRIFIHWLRYGTYLSAELEDEGVQVSVLRVRNTMAGELLRQFRSQPDLEHLLKRLWILLPENEQSPWFDMLAPRFRDRWPVLANLARKFQLEPSDLFVRVTAISLANLDIEPSDFRLDGVLEVLSKEVEEVNQEEWFSLIDPSGMAGIDSALGWERQEVDLLGEQATDRLTLGISLDQQSEFSFPDLVRFVLQKRSFPSWSTIYSPNQFADLLSEVVRRQPGFWNRFFSEEFGLAHQLENFLSMVGTERALRVISEVWSLAVTQIKESIEGLTRAHAGLGPAPAIGEYFVAKLLKERYRDQAAAWGEIVQHVLQSVSVDFGFTLEDHRRLLIEQNIQTEAIRIFLARPLDETRASWPVDAVLYLVLNGQPPWWAPFTKPGQIPELLEEALRDNAENFFRTVERTSESDRFYRGIFYRIDVDLFLKMSAERYAYAADSLKVAAAILSRWPIPLSFPGWFIFSWDFLKGMKWDAAVYAAAFIDYLMSIDRLASATTAKQLLDIIRSVEGAGNNKNIYRIAAEALLARTNSSVRPEGQLTDAGWNTLLKAYLKTGALPQDPSFRILTFSSFLKGVRGYSDRNTVDTAQIIRENLASNSIFDRLVWNEPVEFLQLLLQTTIGDRLRSLNDYWRGVQPLMESIYQPRTEEWWFRVWADYLLRGVRSGRKLSSDDNQEVAYFLLGLESRINISVSFTAGQLVNRGLSENLVRELSKGGSKLLSAPAESYVLLPSLTKSEWEAALRKFLTSGAWPTEFSVTGYVTLPALLRQQSSLSTGEFRQLLIKLLGAQELWGALRRRDDLESAEGFIESIFPTDFPDLRSLGSQVIDSLHRYWPVLPSHELRWTFLKNLVDAAQIGSSTRLILARFAGNTVRSYGLDVSMLINDLRTSGYPVQWLDGFLADAGLAESNEIPTPVQLVAEKVAFFNPQSTLDYFLRTEAWPTNVELAGLDLRAFLRKARQEPAFRAEAMFGVIRSALGNDRIRRRIAEQRSYDTFKALRDFMFSKLTPELETLQQVTIKLLRGLPEEKITFQTGYALLELMAGPYSEYLPFEQIFQRVIIAIKDLYGSNRFRRDDLLKAEFPPSWILILERSGEMASGQEESEQLISMAPPEADLIHYYLIENQLPWWADKLGVSDVNDETVRRLVGQVLYTSPGALVSRIQNDPQPEEMLNSLARHLNQDDFFALLSAWPSTVKEVVIPFTRLIASALPEVTPALWYSFAAGQLIKLRPFVVDEFVLNALNHLERLSGRSTFEVYKIFTAREAGRRSVGRDIQKLLDGMFRIISVPEPEENVLARIPLLDFNQVVLDYLRTGAIPSGMLPDIQNRTAFLQFLRYQVSLGNAGLGDMLRLAVRENATRDRLLRAENTDLLGLITQVLFPRIFRAMDNYRRQLYRFFRNQNQFLTEERFSQSFYGALLNLYNDQTSDADGVDQVFSLVFRVVKDSLQYKSVIRADGLKRFGFGADILDALIRSDSGVEAGPDIVEAPDDLLEDTVDVQNAGLVILWPFLGRYFDLLEMTEKGEFKSPELAARAALLLQFIATGKATAAEHELLLNKLLCGILPSMPVPREIELTDKETEITDMMLKGVLQNWEKLRNSSVDALREGFLVRDGYLREKEMLWELQVEKRTLDILMKSMPWSFGTVKLPWMKKRLVVQWL